MCTLRSIRKLFGIGVLAGVLQLTPALALAQDAAPSANLDAASYILPSPEVQQILHTDKNYATLEYMSPNGDHFLVPRVNELSTLALMSKTTYRLGELELRPSTDRLWNLDTWGIYDFRFYSLSARAYVDVDLPEGAFASDFTWSPQGDEIAFLAHLPTHTEVWVADAASGNTRSLSDAPVMATIGTDTGGQGTTPSSMLQWTPEGTVLTLLVPEGRGDEPARNPVPSSPVVRRTREEPTRTPTYPNLLEDAHDEMLFEFYTTSQLAELGNGEPRLLGEPRMYESLSLSPDGRHLLVTFIERPFSYITSYRGFPRTTAVLDRAGRLVSTLQERPLQEGRNGGPERGARGFAWRPDGAGISFLRRDDGPESEQEQQEQEAPDEAPRLDRIFLLTPPFDLDGATPVAQSEDPIGRVTYSLDGRHAFAEVTRSGESALAHWVLGGAAPAGRQLLRPFRETEDPLEEPGRLMELRTPNGLVYAPISSDGQATFVSGPGYAADYRPTPFIDRVALADGTTNRVFTGAKESFDRPLVPLDADMTRLVASRESKTDFPDSYLWQNGNWGDNLTNNRDPFPEFAGVERIDFSFTRRDGLEVQGRVSMPLGWTRGDGPVPAIFWTYPREYEQPEGYEHAAIRSRNVNAFTHMSWLRWSDIWLAAGYALVYPDIPIIGENYNDTYIGNLVDAMYGAIRAVDSLGVVDVDRLAHGGHSYGAFATANILANAPFFKAGIAGDGAYNRSLTPDGFQSERRNIWEAPHTYIEMSPFFKADQLDTPILLYHGGDDNNTGTFPVQSRRLISALTILGKEAVLYEYPYESHTPRAIENKLDMWARMIGWLDEHLKGTVPSATDAQGGP